MRRILIETSALLAILGVACSLSLQSAAQSKPQHDGKKLFLSQKCNVCHAASSAGIKATAKEAKYKGPDLSKIKRKWEVSALTDYLRNKTKVNGKLHKEVYERYEGEQQVMPGYADDLRNLEMKAMAEFVKDLSKK